MDHCFIQEQRLLKTQLDPRLLYMSTLSAPPCHSLVYICCNSGPARYATHMLQNPLVLPFQYINLDPRWRCCVDAFMGHTLLWPHPTRPYRRPHTPCRMPFRSACTSLSRACARRACPTSCGISPPVPNQYYTPAAGQLPPVSQWQITVISCSSCCC